MMVWVYIHASDGSLLLLCPAEDANLWNLLNGTYWFRYELQEEPSCL